MLYYKNKLYCRLCFLCLIVMFGCSERKPEVKVQNDSDQEISVFFQDLTCSSCPSIMFLNIKAHSESDYKTCSTKGYYFSIKSDGIEKISNIKFQPNFDEKYIIIINNELKCEIRTLSN